MNRLKNYFFACVYDADNNLICCTGDTYRTTQDALRAGIAKTTDDGFYYIDIYSTTNMDWSVYTYAMDNGKLLCVAGSKHCYLFYGRRRNGRLFEVPLHTDKPLTGKKLFSMSKKYFDAHDLDSIAVYDLTAEVIDADLGQRVTDMVTR